jgi:DNA-binding transcriptional LysR family regulator
VAEFLRRCPEVQVELVCTDRVVDLVDEGFDVAVRAGPLRDSTLIARPLGTVRSVVVGAPPYLARRGTPRRPADLARHDCVVFAAGSTRDTWILVDGEQRCEQKVHARLAANDVDVVREAVLAGLGVGLVPADRCAADIEAGRLRRVLRRWTSTEIAVHAVYPTTRHLAPKVAALLDHLSDHWRRSPAS